MHYSRGGGGYVQRRRWVCPGVGMSGVGRCRGGLGMYVYPTPTPQTKWEVTYKRSGFSQTHYMQYMHYCELCIPINEQFLYLDLFAIKDACPTNAHIHLSKYVNQKLLNVICLLNKRTQYNKYIQWAFEGTIKSFLVVWLFYYKTSGKSKLQLETRLLPKKLSWLSTKLTVIFLIYSLLLIVISVLLALNSNASKKACL